ncbi:HAMP domain-containing protein, partial [Patescibacteria group bacterium]
MRFFKTIRFKLTLWYSLFLVILSFLFVFSVNLVVTQHYAKDPINHFRKTRLERMLSKPPGGPLNNFQGTKEVIEEIRQDDLNRLRQLSWIAFGVLVVLSFGGGYFIAGRMLSPLKKINETAKRINAQNLHTKIKHPDVDDEIGELIGNFNKMIARLNRSFDLQKQFVENASHELKTPLAIAQTNLDSALSKKKVSKKDLESSAQITLQSIKFMDKLIEDLLLLSLSEKDIKFKKINLTGILKNSVEHLNSLT